MFHHPLIHELKVMHNFMFWYGGVDLPASFIPHSHMSGVHFSSASVPSKSIPSLREYPLLWSIACANHPTKSKSIYTVLLLKVASPKSHLWLCFPADRTKKYAEQRRMISGCGWGGCASQFGLMIICGEEFHCLGFFQLVFSNFYVSAPIPRFFPPIPAVDRSSTNY